ncbi:MAG: UDP-N-acetylmuramoyl-L-alanyl-D-glutamate--2,6-diaminopimelate ligase [Bdellovibrionaceae bacterium]|nr:UDP-N-acetylmuramoyl-L-alanyl-D-glutamate--2,6-diaminopimelate ligase [Pseudobdellovibrionaceae bacterium]
MSMKLSQLFAVFPQLNWGDAALKEVSSVEFDSRRLAKNCVFVAVRGGRHDGHDFLSEAVRIGAIGLVVEDATRVPADFGGAVAIVSDARQALNRLAARWFHEPATRLFCVGVTGTNGKTTTTYMIEEILTAFGWTTGVIGTINHHVRDHVWATEMTTPDPLSFQRRLQEFEAFDAKAVALEVSSHALRQSRVDEVPFDVAVFTNLSRDHLDYHPDMEDYFQAKVKLFHDLLARSHKPSRFAVVNRDDAYGRRITSSGGATLWTYGEKDADLTFELLSQDFTGTRVRLRTPRGEGELSLPMPGVHNVYNAIAAIAVGLAAGASLSTCLDALARFKGVRGRLEAVPNKKGIHVFVDFAHTDAALEGVLANLNRVRESAGLKNRVITVFGCGGDRDKGKRPLMMQAALKGSDVVVLTSDNPRTEDPWKILHDALKGADPSAITSRRVRTEVDRRQAIGLALEEARPGDVVLIAGKGHETYQQIGTEKFPFSDFDVVAERIG